MKAGRDLTAPGIARSTNYQKSPPRTYMMRIDREKDEIVHDDLQHVTKELTEKTHMLK